MHCSQQFIDDLCKRIVRRATDSVGASICACGIFQYFHHHRYYVLHIDWLKLHLATTYQWHHGSRTNKVRQTFNKRCILAEQNRGLNDCPIQTTLFEHLFGKVPTVPIASRLIWPPPQST